MRSYITGMRFFSIHNRFNKGNYLLQKNRYFNRLEQAIFQDETQLLSKTIPIRTSSNNYPRTVNYQRSVNLSKQHYSLSDMSTISQDKSLESQLREKFQPRERKFKTQFGHIAALEWGKEEAPNKILCVHGWLDNAGSFERLIPFVMDHKENENQYHIIAMDHPGVGLSSHKPSGAEYTQFSTIIEMRRIAEEMKWQKFSLLSHSLGSHFSFVYCCLYPDQLESFISIDLAHPIAKNPDVITKVLANTIEEHFKVEHNVGNDPTKNIKVPVYSELDAINRLMDLNSLTRESAQVMLKRGATKERWGYTFNRDVRLKRVFVELGLDDDLMLKYLDCSFQPNLLIIRALQSAYQSPTAIRQRYYDMFQKKCPLFRDVTLDGTHHLHMNNPELVAPEVCRFLDDVRNLRESRLTKESKL